MKNLFIPAFALLTACAAPEDRSGGWNATPDRSVDRKEFERQYALNPQRWDAAFEFLRRGGFDTMASGRHEIDGEELYVNVDRYMTRDEADGRYESHRRYADIQYVASGEEMIGVMPLREAVENTPYDEAKDILFFKEGDGQIRHAGPDNYFVFFPGDVHRPGVKAGGSVAVVKVVVKVKLP